MRRDVGVSLLIPLVLLDEVKIIPTNNDGPIHLSTVACSSDDATPDRHSAGEWTFLINVGSFNGFPGCLETKANVLPESVSSLARFVPLGGLLGTEKHLGLLQESPFRLLRHGCRATGRRRNPVE